jgi:hypothetical protein
VLLQDHTYVLRRGTLYGRWRVHGQEGCTLLWSFWLRRGTLKLSVHLSLEGGTLDWRVLYQGKIKGKARVKCTSKGKVKEKEQWKRYKG